MPFSSLIGNPVAKNALQKMVEKQAIPSTLLFYGQEGIGKKTAARLLAEYLLGPKAKALHHPDLHFFEPTGKAHLHPIESIRSVIHEASLPPFEAPCKLFIFDDAEKMLPSSSNALLKILEEPFAHSFFILITTDKDALLPTLVSRCRKIPFFPVPQKEIEQWLLANHELKEQQARKIAFLSHGSLGKAVMLTKKAPPWKEDLITLLTLHIKADYPQWVQVASKLETHFSPSDEAPPSLDTLFEEIAMWYRDLHLLKEKGAIEHLYHLDHLEQLRLALQGPLPLLEVVLQGLERMQLGAMRSIHLRHLLEYFFLHI